MGQTTDTAMITDLRKELEREAEEENIPILRRAERKLLLEAAAAADPKKILEVGTAIGYSALLLAEHFPLAEIDTIEIDALRNERTVSVMQAAGFEQRVRCHLGDAGEVLSALAGPYDFVYLDGPKGQYLRHLKLIEPKLSENAVIAADNVLFRGLVRSGEPVAHRYRTLVTRLREYLEYVEAHYDTVIHEEGDGLAKKVELLAPAGNMEKMKMALLYGADAVYMAGKAFGLRAYGGNFTREEMKEAVEYAHSMGKKVYITVNIIPRNEDLEGLDAYLKYLQDIHVDAVLISHLGVFDIARAAAPDLPVHVSTQASAANWRTVRRWKDMGASRVVLAREVSLSEMADIRKRVDIELEVFGHGALCISWSGRCLLSNYFTNGKRQSNRGECIQACRFKYSVMEESRPGQYFPVEEDEHGTYIFNSKDLCMIDHIPELIEAGVSSLKIEERLLCGGGCGSVPESD